MLTIFTIPKPFTEQHIKTIQRNAIQGWLKFNNCEVILAGNDNGVKETAQEFKIKHIPEIKCNEFGTPLLSSAFALVKKHSKNNLLCYINADIILLNNISDAIKILPEKNFLAVGRRIDLDIKKEINFKNNNWQNNLNEKIKNNGTLHFFAGIDYFIFNRDSFNNLPPFAVGRIGWDNWMILEARRKKNKIIDMTSAITAVHQNHDYPNFNKGRERKNNPEAKKNKSYIKNSAQAFTIEDANWKIDNNKLKKKWLYKWPLYKRYIKLFLKNNKINFLKN
ncbi:hypothetical protein KAJ61_02135 [Candidatus Parcubacteria bacterium]|nr:hypothetical protein [Candidatus Parcubacteria bacterium]